MYASINQFKNYFEKLEQEMSLRNPSKVSLIRQIKNISLKNAMGKASDEKTRKALEDLLARHGINPGVVRRNEQYALTVGLAKPAFDYDGNGLTDLVEHGSKSKVNLLAGARTKRNKGLLGDFKQTKNISNSNGLFGELNKKVVSKSSNVNVLDLGKKIKSSSKGLGLEKYGKSSNGNVMGDLMSKNKFEGLNFGVASSKQESVIGAFKALSGKERKINVKQKGIIGALVGAGKK